MRKLLTFIIFVILTPSLCLAQNFDFKKAFSDYLHNFNLYRDAHLGYVSAKSEYLAYETLASQTKALEKTRSMLEKRDNVLICYLTALRTKLAETTRITNYEQNMKYIFLDNQISFLKVNKENLSSPGSLEDLLKVSAEVEEKYKEIELLSFQTLGIISSSQVEKLHKETERQTQKIEEKINQMRNEGEKTATLERWLLEVKEKNALSAQKYQEAKNILTAMSTKDQNKKQKWLVSLGKFEEAVQYLKESTSYLKEIVREIKYE